MNLGASLQNVASLAFVDAFQAVAVFSAAVLFAVAVVVGIVLRDVAVGRGTAGQGGLSERVEETDEIVPTVESKEAEGRSRLREPAS